MTVRQKCVGWLGTLIDDVVCNGSISFNTSMFGTSQLSPCEPDINEVKRLIRDLKENCPEGYEKAVKYLELKYNITYTHEERIADVKMGRFRKEGKRDV